MTALKVEGLTAGYTGAPVIRDLNLRVEPGELVALLGPNGAGKTTTLLAISGLISRAEGTVLLQGNDITQLSPTHRAQRGLQHVPEDRSLFPSLTVAETLKLVETPDVDRKWIDDLFPALVPLAKRPVAALSGGEQQMLTLARALSLGPSVLMVDEMSLGLAPKIVASLFPVLRRVAEERGCGVLIVEQHVHLALDAVDRAYVIGDGEIVAEGSADEIKPKIVDLINTYLG